MTGTTGAPTTTTKKATAERDERSAMSAARCLKLRWRIRRRTPRQRRRCAMRLPGPKRRPRATVSTSALNHTIGKHLRNDSIGHNCPGDYVTRIIAKKPLDGPVEIAPAIWPFHLSASRKPISSVSSSGVIKPLALAFLAASMSLSGIIVPLQLLIAAGIV